MADSTQNSSSLTNQSTDSTIYNLNLNVSIDANDPQRVEESINSSGLNESSKSSNSVLLTDSSHVLEDFPGFSKGDQVISLGKKNTSEDFQKISTEVLYREPTLC